MRRIVLFSIIISFLLPSPGLASLKFTHEKPARSGFQLISSVPERTTILFETPGYDIRQINIDGKIYDTLHVNNTQPAGNPGAPQLLQLSVLVGVPADATINLKIVQDEYSELQGDHRLLPTAIPSPIKEDFEPGGWHRKEDPAAYQSKDYLPSSAVAISGDSWLRDQRILRLSYYPFQYNAANGSIRWHSRVMVVIDHQSNTLAASSSAIPDGSADPFDELLNRSLINYEAARAQRLPDERIASLALVESQTMLDTPAYRIEVRDDGIYRIPYDTLRAVGLNPESIDPAAFRITNQGDEIAIHVVAGEYILFYGEKYSGDRMAERYASEDDLWTPLPTQLTDGSNATWTPHLNAMMFEKYTDVNVYWLSVGEVPGKRMASVNGMPGSAPVPSSYRKTQREERSSIWKTTLFTNEESWYWDLIDISDPAILDNRVYTTTVSAPFVNGDPVMLRGEIVAEFTNDNISPDHHIRAYWNDPEQALAPVVEETWDGKSRMHFEAAIGASRLVSGQNQMDLTVERLAGLYREKLYFDWFEIEYDSQFVAENDHLLFNFSGTWRFVITGFTGNNPKVLDITDSHNPVLINNFTYSNGSISFESNVSGDASYATGGWVDIVPANLVYYAPPSFSQAVDNILIAPRDFVTVAQSLANYRTDRGVPSAVYALEDLINVFNDGIYHPLAIKNFLRYAFANWSKPPTYVLLIGDGHWNFKGYPAYDNPPIYMPPNLAWVDPWQGEVDSANLLATIVGDDPLPDVMIGRLPVNSLDQLTYSIIKIISYEYVTYKQWHKNFVFVADNTPDPAGDFVGFSEDIIQDYLTSDWSVQRIYLDDFSDDALATKIALLDAVNNTGALVVNYSGHASLNLWAGEQILTNADVALFQNTGKLPVILSMTCLDGYWIHPNLAVGEKSGQGLIETLVLAVDSNKLGVGAVAAFSPTGLGVATGHDALQRGFYDALIDNHLIVLGAAASSAKLRLYETGINFDLLQTFTVFGDPALQIRLPPRPIKLPYVVKP